MHTITNRIETVQRSVTDNGKCTNSKIYNEKNCMFTITIYAVKKSIGHFIGKSTNMTCKSCIGSLTKSLSKSKFIFIYIMNPGLV